MKLDEVVSSLMARSPSRWPALTCCAIRPRGRDVCGADARWMKLPIRGAKLPWLYCDRCRPRDAEPIPSDTAFMVTRLEIRVAVSSAPGDRQAAAEDAVIKIVAAIEGVGGLVTGLRVPARKASAPVAVATLGRLQLAGRPQPIPARRPLLEAPTERAPWFTKRRRRTG